MDYQYIFYGIIGAIGLPLMYHLSLKQNSKLCALIPALPLLGITGLILTNMNTNGNKNKHFLTKDYLKNIITFITLALTIYIIIYLLYEVTNNVITSITISLIIGSILFFYILSKKNKK